MEKYSSIKLAQFWDYVIEKGLMNKETANSRKVASLKVLADLDDADRQDLRNLDRSVAFSRFQNLSGKRYTPSSLNVYRSRFNSAVDDFIAFTDDPSNFKSSIGSKTSSKAATGSAKRDSAAKTRLPTRKAAIHEPVIATPAGGGGSAESLMLPIPIRPGLVVKIFGLPSDLSIGEAKKIAAVVMAYGPSE